MVERMVILLPGLLFNIEFIRQSHAPQVRSHEMKLH